MARAGGTRGRGGRTRERAVPGARHRAGIAVARLREEYPDAVTALAHAGTWQLLVATILSAQTTDVRVNLVTPVLFARYPSPADLAAADAADVEEVIRSTGFFRSKTRAIMEMSRDVAEIHGGRVPETLEGLVTLRGVGRKTANVVLGSAFGAPGFAVDTHVRRLSRRLRLTRSDDPVRIERDVCALVPSDEWSALSLRLILHGRRVCTARSPRCGSCVLADVCPSAFTFEGARAGCGTGAGPGRRRPSARVPGRD